MKQRIKKPEILKKLRDNIAPNSMKSMLILGLDISLDKIDSVKDKDRVIIYLNNALLKSRTDFDKMIKDVITYKNQQDAIKANIMKNASEFGKIDPSLFKLLDASS